MLRVELHLTNVKKKKRRKERKKKCGRKGGYRITIKQTPPIAADEDPPREDKTGG